LPQRLGVAFRPRQTHNTATIVDIQASDLHQAMDTISQVTGMDMVLGTDRIDLPWVILTANRTTFQTMDPATTDRAMVEDSIADSVIADMATRGEAMVLEDFHVTARTVWVALDQGFHSTWADSA